MIKYRIKGTAGAHANQVFKLAGRLVFGRSDDSDVRIEHDDVSPHHCELQVSDDNEIRLRDLQSTSGTRVNGVRVEQAILNSGDEISIANSRFLLQAPGLRPKRVLTEEAVKRSRSHVPWLLVSALILAAALAWQRGWLNVFLA